MLRHVDNVNVLLFEFPITDCWGEALKVLAMISLEERVRKPIERVHRANMTQSSLLKYLIWNNKPHPDPNEKSYNEKRTGG